VNWLRAIEDIDGPAGNHMLFKYDRLDAVGDHFGFDKSRNPCRRFTRAAFEGTIVPIIKRRVTGNAVGVRRSGALPEFHISMRQKLRKGPAEALARTWRSPLSGDGN